MSSRNPPGLRKGESPGIGEFLTVGSLADWLSAGSGYLQNGVEYPSPYNYSIYTDYLKVSMATVILGPLARLYRPAYCLLYI